MRLSTTTRRWLAAGAAALTIGGGGAGLALAQGGATTSGPPAAVQAGPDRPEPGDVADRADAHDDGLAPGTASIQVPNGGDEDERSEKAEAPGAEREGREAGEGAEDRGEAAEAARLAPLATVAKAQAERAALAEVPGTVTAVELGNENGNLVWEVDVTAKDGTQHEVKVDAGNGTVLIAEADDQR